MRETFLGAVTHGATKGTTPTVLLHCRRHLLSAGSMPSPMEAAHILCAEPASSHFLADGVGDAAHHAARSITPPRPSCGLLPNTVSPSTGNGVRKKTSTPGPVMFSVRASAMRLPITLIPMSMRNAQSVPITPMVMDRARRVTRWCYHARCARRRKS